MARSSQHEIGAFLAEAAKGGIAVVGGNDAVTGAAYQGRDGADHGRLVVDDQNQQASLPGTVAVHLRASVRCRSATDSLPFGARLGHSARLRPDSSGVSVAHLGHAHHKSAATVPI